MITYLGIGAAYLTLNMLVLFIDFIFKDGDRFEECINRINDIFDDTVGDERYKMLFITAMLMEIIIAWPLNILIAISSKIFKD